MTQRNDDKQGKISDWAQMRSEADAQYEREYFSLSEIFKRNVSMEIDGKSIFWTLALILVLVAFNFAS